MVNQCFSLFLVSSVGERQSRHAGLVFREHVPFWDRTAAYSGLVDTEAARMGVVACFEGDHLVVDLDRDVGFTAYCADVNCSC